MPDPSSMPTRRSCLRPGLLRCTRSGGTLLDVADSWGTKGLTGSFTEKDIEAFLDAFDVSNGAKDYSRYDLNGDGKTGR